MLLVPQGHVVIFKVANLNRLAPSVVTPNMNVIYQNIAQGKMNFVQMTSLKLTERHVKWLKHSVMMEHAELILINVSYYGAHQGRNLITNVMSKIEKEQGMAIVAIIG
jgi:hypothetical protein